MDSHGTYYLYTYDENISRNPGLLDKITNCKDLNEIKSLKPLIKNELKEYF